jgi:hypothetical protein
MFLTFEVADDNSVGPKSTQLKIQKKEFITNTVLEKIGESRGGGGTTIYSSLFFISNQGLVGCQRI